SSRPTAAAVISASVVSGAISEIAPTVVVLPTPKPPAMMIFTGIGARGPSEGTAAWPVAAASGRYSGDRTESTHHSQDAVGVMSGHDVHRVDVEIAGGAQVADEYAGHAEVQPQAGGDLGHRDRLRAQPDDGLHFRGQVRDRHRGPEAGGRARGHLGLQPDVRV